MTEMKELASKFAANWHAGSDSEETYELRRKTRNDILRQVITAEDPEKSATQVICFYESLPKELRPYMRTLLLLGVTKSEDSFGEMVETNEAPA